MGLLRRKRGAGNPQPDVYEGLRKQILDLSPDQLGVAFADAPVLALLLETGYPEAVATLVGVVDGTSSLYFSNGGRIIGAGTRPAVAEANRRWLEIGATFLPRLSVVTNPPVPGTEMTQFVAVTPHGLRGAVAREQELGEGEHELSPFFYAAQDVITQIRLSQVADRRASRSARDPALRGDSFQRPGSSRGGPSQAGHDLSARSRS